MFASQTSVDMEFQKWLQGVSPTMFFLSPPPLIAQCTTIHDHGQSMSINSFEFLFHLIPPLAYPCRKEPPSSTHFRLGRFIPYVLMYVYQCFHVLALTFMVITSDTSLSLDMAALGWWLRSEQGLEHGSASYAITTCISCELHLHRESGLGLAGRWCGLLYLNHCAWAL